MPPSDSPIGYPGAEPVGDSSHTESPLRILMATLGTRGTLNPLLAIAEELRHRGHTVVFAVPDRWKALITDLGYEHRLLRPDPEARPAEETSLEVERKSETALRNTLFPGVEDTYRDILAASEGCDAIAAHYILLPTPMAGERRNIPWMPVYFAPGTLNSMYDPPVIPMLPAIHGMQRASPLVARILNRLFKLYTKKLYTPYRELRAREGLPPESRCYILDGTHSPWGDLCLFSETIGARQPDWSPHATATGFPFLHERWGEEHRELLRFLDAGKPPIVVCIGTSKLAHMRPYFAASMEAARQLGRRIVMLTGHAEENLPAGIDPSFAMAVPYAPYGGIFPRSCAIVHSGAVGAFAEALRAGEPMLVVPSHAADQPDNAARAVRMGVGKTLPLADYTADAATTALHAILTAPTFATRAAAVGAIIRSEDGAARAADLLVMATRRASRQTPS